jgi:hypothetical protein
MFSMRELMLMVETERPREGPPVPDTLFHGTGEEAWNSIQESDTMYSSDHRDEDAISFTTDWHTANRFAQAVAKREGGAGVIIEFNGDDLARKFNVEPFSDSGLVHAEQEWLVKVGSITQVTRYIIGVEKVSA